MQSSETKKGKMTGCIALDYLDTVNNQESSIKSRIIGGIVKYLSSEAYLLDTREFSFSSTKELDAFEKRQSSSGRQAVVCGRADDRQLLLEQSFYRPGRK